MKSSQSSTRPDVTFPALQNGCTTQRRVLWQWGPFEFLVSPESRATPSTAVELNATAHRFDSFLNISTCLFLVSLLLGGGNRRDSKKRRPLKMKAISVKMTALSEDPSAYQKRLIVCNNQR
jgi:hypothetical protein